MTMRSRPWLLCALIAVLTATLYFRALDEIPPHVSGDEVKFATQAAALASSGRDLNGQRLPLFLTMTDPIISNNSTNVWFQPMLFYLIALTLKVAPLTEWSIRLPSALIGVLDVVLVFVLARRLFAKVWQAALAATLLALAPAHFIMSRVAADYICSVPFTLAWLLCLVTFFQRRDVRLLFVAGLLLGAGFYSYIAAWVMMPLYVLLTVAVIWMAGERRIAAILAPVAGFALPLSLFVLWSINHPAMLHDTLARYALIDPQGPFGLSAGLPRSSNAVSRLSVYWDYFNPAYLFLAGGANLMDSTRRAGLFLLPAMAFVPCGVVALWTRRSEISSRLILLGFVTAPVAATLLNERYCADRELFVLPFATVICVEGAASLMADRRTAARALAMALCLAVPLHFAVFYRDYTTDYRARVVGWFDPFETSQVAEYVVSRDSAEPVPAVYLSTNMEYMNVGGYRWRFQMLKHSRLDLWARTRYFAGPDSVPQLPAGSVIVFGGKDPLLEPSLETGQSRIAKIVTDPSGGRAVVIVRAGP